MDRIESKWTKWTDQDQIVPNVPNRTEVDSMDLIGPNRIKVNQIGSKWTEYDQSGQNGPNMTKLDRRKQNGPNRTNMD